MASKTTVLPLNDPGVETRGFEPRTFGLRYRCSASLSYVPMSLTIPVENRKVRKIDALTALFDVITLVAA